MGKIKLSNITSVITKGTTPMTIGYTFQDEGINFVKIECINENGTFVFNKLEHISNECNEKLSRSILFENDILFSIAGALGRTAIVTKEILPANINQALAIIRLANPDCLPKYVQYTLKSENVYKQFQLQKQGVAQLNLSLKNIGDLEIPLPPLETQKQISKTLDTVAELLVMRKQQLVELDNLIKSTFCGMFGNSVKNEKGWSQCYINDIFDIIDGDRGMNYPKQDDFTDEGYCVFLNTGNVTKDGFNFSNIKFISKEKDKQLRKGKAERGDIIFTTRGTVGNIVYYTDSVPYDVVRINSGMVLLRSMDISISPLFFCEMFKTDEIKRELKSLLSGTAQPQLPITNMKKIKIILPPINLQTQFASIVTKIEEQKTLVKKAIDETQYLLDSLMSEYFD